MIILRFGKTGRLARICGVATRLALPGCRVVSATRAETFQEDESSAIWSTIDEILRDYPDEKFLVLDASIDHSSIAALIAHESFKRTCISTINRQLRLWRAVGISSGITQVSPSCILPAAQHMLEYRQQKLAQEALFSQLDCPVFLPQLFTLVGSITFGRQSTAWAQVLKARLDRSDSVILNEPHSRKAWASEYEVLRRLMAFLLAKAPSNVMEPLVQGSFTLEEVACGEQLPFPPLVYAKGSDHGWLTGDYLPQAPIESHQSIFDELLRSAIT